MWEKEGKQLYVTMLMTIYDMTTPAKGCHIKLFIVHYSCALSCSLFYCISGLFADMDGNVISCDSEFIKC